MAGIEDTEDQYFGPMYTVEDVDAPSKRQQPNAPVYLIACAHQRIGREEVAMCFNIQDLCAGGGWTVQANVDAEGGQISSRSGRKEDRWQAPQSSSVLPSQLRSDSRTSSAVKKGLGSASASATFWRIHSSSSCFLRSAWPTTSLRLSGCRGRPPGHTPPILPASPLQARRCPSSLSFSFQFMAPYRPQASAALPAGGRHIQFSTDAATPTTTITGQNAAKLPVNCSSNAPAAAPKNPPI